MLHHDYSEDTVIAGLEKVKKTKNDIAVVKLAWSISYSNNIKPVCLSKSDDIPQGTKIEVSGFGKKLFI